MCDFWRVVLSIFSEPTLSFLDICRTGIDATYKKRIRTALALLHSFSDKCLWIRYKPYSPLTYGLNSIATVLQEGYL